MTTPDAPDSLASRVAAFEKRMVAVEAHATPAAGDTGNTNGAQGSSPSTQDYLWALRGLKQYEDDSEGGTVMLVGSVELPGSGPVSWQIGAHADELLSDEWDTVTAVLDALAHPIRLRILKEVLTGENSTARELAELESMGSTGQVYHHLRALTSAGWLRPGSGGRHTVPAERVVPLLTTLLGARR